MNLTASAATSGGENTKTINVQTTANWSRPGSESITLKQSKCKYTYQQFNLKKYVTKTASIYPHYTIAIKNEKTGKTTHKNWSSGSIKLSLDRNTNYTITVSYDWSGTWLASNCKLDKWTNSPYWYVSGTNKASCW